MAHRQPRTADRLDQDFAGSVTEIVQSLGTPSREQILGRVLTGPWVVSELPNAAGMEPSTLTHQSGAR